MLPDPDRELLTAYVDGELSARRRRHLRRLLHRSPEARALLRQMQQDARALRHLPRPPRPGDLSGPVLRTLAERGLLHGGPSLTAARGVPAWAGLAAAAAVLFAVGLSSYLYFAASLDHRPALALAQHQPRPDFANPSPDRTPSSAPDLKKEQPHATPSSQSEVEPEKAPLSSRPRVAKARPRLRGLTPSNRGGNAEDSRPKEDVVGSGDGFGQVRPETVQVALPVVLRLNDLEQPPGREKLAGELKSDRAFRVELPCKDGTRALGRLQEVLKARHTTLLTDAVARDRLDRPRFKSSYALYAEDLTPAELTDLLRQVGREDHKAAARRPADGHFSGDLVVARMSSLDHKQLADLMGVNPTRVAPPEPHSQGGPPAPAASRRSGPVVLVLAFSPVRSRPGSAEIKRFLEGRTPARPGTVSVLLVLRDTSG